jgi:hypothetical protein
MRLSIEGGTARHDGPSLCLSCRYATIVRGVSLRHEIVECRRLSEPRNRIVFPVTFCSGYLDRQHPSIGEMEDLAWVLRSDPKRKQMGFVKASELQPRERYVLPDEWL